MSARETVHRALEALNQHDARAYAALYAADAVVYDPFYTEPLRGREAVQRDAEDLLRGFPDLHGKISTAMEDGRTISVESELVDTHRGAIPTPTGEIPPTGRRVQMRSAIFAELNRDGQIVEEHRYYDVAGFLNQIGIVPVRDVEPPLPR